MSEPTAHWVTNLKDAFLECPVCFDAFNQTDRRPRLLHECLHAFCTVCLDKLIQKEGGGRLTCPICRHVAKVKGKATSFPADPVRSKLLDFVKMKKEKKALCNDCPDGHEADSRCKECSLFLCKECRYVHKRHKMTSNHSILNLEQVLEQPLKQLSTPHFCTKHPDHKLEFFCSTDESLCCLSCTVLDHQGHKFEKIEEALIPRRRDLDTRLQETNNHVFSLRNQRQSVETNKAAILQDKMAMTSEIEKEFSKLERQMQIKKQSLLKEVEQNSQEKVAFCDKNLQAIDESLATLESTQSYIAQANQNSDAVEMLQMLPALKQSLAGSSHTSSSAAEQTPRVVFDSCFVSTAEKMIPLIGQLQVQSGADQPSGAREYRDCVEQVMSVCLESRDGKDLKKRIGQLLGQGEQQAELGSTRKKSQIESQTSHKPKPVKTGDRIPGEMTSRVIGGSCEGYEDVNTIEIRYDIPAGSTSTKFENTYDFLKGMIVPFKPYELRCRQYMYSNFPSEDYTAADSSADSPSQRYFGADYTAYLPNNREGQKVLSLLKVAWGRGLTYKLEEGRWSLQILHKKYRTLMYSKSYPDPHYLHMVQEELCKLGVTEEDISTSPTQ